MRTTMCWCGLVSKYPHPRRPQPLEFPNPLLLHRLRGYPETFSHCCLEITQPPRGFVKLLRLRCASGKRVPLPSPIRPLGGPLRACHFGPTRESLPHLLTIVGC